MPGLILIPMILSGSVLLLILYFGIKAKAFPKPMPMTPLTDAYWQDVEQQTAGVIPASLRRLYADHVLINRMDLSFSDPATGKVWPVDAFLWPQEEPCLKEIEPLGRVFCFADTGQGDYYFIQLLSPGETSPAAARNDAPVAHWNHETGEILQVAPTLTDFLSWQQEGDALEADAQAS